MSDYLQGIPLSTPVKDIRVTATKKTLKFVTAKPVLKLVRGEPQEVMGELRYRFRVHLTRLEKRGFVEIEPLDKTEPSAAPAPKKTSKKKAAKKAAPAPEAGPIKLDVQLGAPTITAPTLGTPEPAKAEEPEAPFPNDDEILGDL